MSRVIEKNQIIRHQIFFRSEIEMAPSGNSAVPQRFRQRRPSPSFNDLTVSSATTEHWENLLDRRKKCKDRNLKVIKFL